MGNLGEEDVNLVRVTVGTMQVAATCAFFAALFATAGCMGPKLPTTAQLTEFNNAGPVQPVVDVETLVKAKQPTGLYRVVAGDVLELHMPAIVHEMIPDLSQPEGIVPHLCRIDDSGNITLPIVGERPVAGRTLSEIEAATVAAYYPRFIIDRPTVVARVVEYRPAKVSIVGGVDQPGIYELRSDEMSLVSLLMKAGGIVKDGAGVIRIRRDGETVEAKPVLLPIQGLNIPFTDAALREGDTVEVERLNPEVFTVIGLVNKVGAFPYPPSVRYNLLQVLSFAGGLNDIADPQYAKVYRQDAAGKMVAVAFKVKGTALTDASNTLIKPGDVIAVEHTLRTDFRQILAEVLRINAGVNVGASYNVDMNKAKNNNNNNNSVRDFLRTTSSTPFLVPQ